MPACAIHKLVADALLVAGGKVLLVKYKDTSPYDGEAGWFIPDDYLKEKEHPADAAARILKEQAGVAGVRLALGDVESFGNGKWHLIFHYRAEVEKSPAVRMGPNVAQAKWFDLRELPPRDACAHHGWAHDIIEKLTGRPPG